MKYFVAIFLTFFVSSNIYFQELAPDFTLTDIDGVTHNLYDYLDDGKTVILDFFYITCIPCQNNAEGVESLYENLGPDGTDEVVVLGLECISSTDDQVAQYAIDFNCSNPQINITEDVPDLYGVFYYPTYFIVCPSRIYTEFFGAPDEIENVLTEGVTACTTSSVAEFQAVVDVFPNPTSESLTITYSISSYDWQIYNLNGKVVLSGKSKGSYSTKIEFNENLDGGIYFLKVSGGGATTVKKIAVIE